MGALPIIAGVGAATQIYGMVKGAQAQADASERNAYFKNLQASELLQRQAINEGIIRQQGEDQSLVYGSGSSGHGLEGTGLGGQLKIHRIVEENISLSRRDAEFKARMLRAGADADTQLASDQMTAGLISGAGSLIQTGASFYSQYQGKKTATDLPTVASAPPTVPAGPVKPYPYSYPGFYGGNGQ